MSRIAVATGAALATSIVIACADSYGVEDAEIGDAGGDVGHDQEDVATDIADASDVNIESDADAGGSCSVANPAGLFYSASFDVGNCEGWAVINGTIEWVPAPNRCGAGACKVCATGIDSPGLMRDLPVGGTGDTFELRFQARGDTFSGGVTFSLFVYAENGTQVGAGQNNLTLLQGQWSPGQVITPTTGPAAAAWPRLYGGTDAPGTCFYLDEIRIARY